MLEEILQAFQTYTNNSNIQSKQMYIDCTYGLGGHTNAILENNPECEVIAFERDTKTFELAQANLHPRCTLYNSRFSEFDKHIDPSEYIYINGVLLDLGISSWQLDNKEFGLSFNHSEQEKLDMRLDQWCNTNASVILNTWSENDLADLFYYYADYKASRKLAKLIINNRPLELISDFTELCKQSYNSHKIHPATLPMMALRIYINEEYDELYKVLNKLHQYLEHDVCIAVLSFHSGEDRIIKQTFKKLESNSQLKVINKKPYIPSDSEIKHNTRARSAKLRLASITKTR